MELIPVGYWTRTNGHDNLWMLVRGWSTEAADEDVEKGKDARTNRVVSNRSGCAQSDGIENRHSHLKVYCRLISARLQSVRI